MKTDERKGIPSASEYHRLANCAGYLNHKCALGPIDREESEDAKSGTRCHAAFAGQAVELTDDEAYCVGRAQEQEDKLLSELGFDPAQCTVIKEQRLFLGDEFTGQPDKVYMQATRALALELKAGRNAVDPAEANMQLRSQAVLIAHNYSEVEEVIVATIQPWVSAKPTVARYSSLDLSYAQAELVENLAATKKPDAPHKAGPWCDYCPCNDVCPERRAANLQVAKQAQSLNLATATGDQLSEFWTRWKEAEKSADRIGEEIARRLAADPQSIPCYELKEGRIIEEITDPETVANRAFAQGVKQEDFLRVVKITKGKLKDELRTVSGKKGRELDDLLDKILVGCVTHKQAAPSVVKVRQA